MKQLILAYMVTYYWVKIFFVPLQQIPSENVHILSCVPKNKVPRKHHCVNCPWFYACLQWNLVCSCVTRLHVNWCFQIDLYHVKLKVIARVWTPHYWSPSLACILLLWRGLTPCNCIKTTTVRTRPTVIRILVVYLYVATFQQPTYLWPFCCMFFGYNSAASQLEALKPEAIGSLAEHSCYHPATTAFEQKSLSCCRSINKCAENIWKVAAFSAGRGVCFLRNSENLSWQKSTETLTPTLRSPE